MGGGKCVWTSGVPHEGPTTPPGCQRDSRGVFAIGTGETSWFQPGRQMGYRHCAVNDVVDSSMTLLTALTAFAAQYVRSSVIYLFIAVVTVWGWQRGDPR